ncbi:hypothetical protein Q7P37_005842 [Cladosporium fusiforme]
MNGNDAELALADIGDEDIYLLEAIVRRAASFPFDSCAQALNAAYKAEFAEQGIDTKHDRVIFNWVSVISKRCIEVKQEDGSVDFLEELNKLLATKGIKLEPTDLDAGSEPTQDLDIPKSHDRHDDKDRRRVSFDDARYEETWLSEHSQQFQDEASDGPGFLKRPPTPGRPYHSQRARSVDSDKKEKSMPRATRNVSSSSLYASEPDGPGDSSMFPTSTLSEEEQLAQREVIFDSFLETKERNMKKHFTHVWHDSLIALSSRNGAAYAIATAHDARTLLRQALDQWRLATQTKMEERHQEEEFERMERRAVWFRSLMLAQKGFEHWHARHLALRTKTYRASQLLLAMRYFRRWRQITIENNAKARQILTRKCITRWRDRTARRHLVHEQATAHYEETLERRLYRTWFWQFCSRKVEDGHDQRLERRALLKISDQCHHVQNLAQQAEAFRSHRLLRSTLHSLRMRIDECQQASASAQAFQAQKTRSKCMQILRIQGRLSPLEKTMSLRVTLTLERKAFSIWHLHLSLTRQAAEVDRKRVLQDAWTNWNDTLRTRALAQRIDERVLVESLYKWVLQERLRLFQRAADARLLRHGLATLHETFVDIEASLEERAATFAVDQRRRRLASSMVSLNVALRRHEDADRAAVEFANSRALPDVLSEWKDKSQHARQLAKWAADARWYCLCSSTLKTWRARTCEHQHQRRRDAYMQVRARVKYSMASKCFTTWRTKGMEVRSMQEEAHRRAQARLFAVGTRAFDQWREATEEQRGREVQATNIDEQRLVVSALSAMLTRHSETVDMEQSALSFRLSTDLALQASALKRLQWATFTASQQTKSADALLERNKDQHVKQMLRHWFAQASASRAARMEATEPNAEPESPSIRPASRAAARSVERFTPSHLRSYTPKGTPGYMNTPSRSRRAGRFRPIPTPAAGTPFAFEPAYLTTTPAPFTAGENSDSPTPAASRGLTPQVTPFSRKLRAGGFGSMPPSALRNSVFGRSTAGLGTGKSVRFARAGRFAQSTAGRIEDPQEEEEEEENRGVHFKSS